MILVSAARALVSLLMQAGQAALTVVPITVQDSASRGDEYALFAFSASGLGPIPEGVRTTLPGVMRVSGQA